MGLGALLPMDASDLSWLQRLARPALGYRGPRSLFLGDQGSILGLTIMARRDPSLYARIVLEYQSEFVVQEREWLICHVCSAAALWFRVAEWSECVQ